MWIKNHMMLGILNASEAYGIQSQQLLDELNISRDQINKSESVMDWDTAARFWEFITRKNNDPYVGLKMGNEVTMGIIGFVGQLSGSCETVLAAFKTAIEFHKVFTQMVDYRFRETPTRFIVEFRLMDEWVKKYPTTSRHAIEMSLTAFSKFLTLLSGKKYFPLKINLHYPPPAKNISAYSSYLHCTPSFNQRISSYAFDKEELKSKVIGSNAEIYFLLRKIAEEKFLPADNNQSLIKNIEYEVYHLLPNKFPSLREVGLRLNLSERTIQRQLKNHNTSFKEIVGNAQKDMAIRLVKENSKNIKEISLLLGYNDSSAFNKSFKRWTGTTPGKFSSNL